MKKLYETPVLELKMFSKTQTVCCASPGDIGDGEDVTLPFGVNEVNNYSFDKEW